MPRCLDAFFLTDTGPSWRGGRGGRMRQRCRCYRNRLGSFRTAPNLQAVQANPMRRQRRCRRDPTGRRRRHSRGSALPGYPFPWPGQVHRSSTSLAVRNGRHDRERSRHPVEQPAVGEGDDVGWHGEGQQQRPLEGPPAGKLAHGHEPGGADADQQRPRADAEHQPERVGDIRHQHGFGEVAPDLPRGRANPPTKPPFEIQPMTTREP